jgi:hypothetical protein
MPIPKGVGLKRARKKGPQKSIHPAFPEDELEQKWVRNRIDMQININAKHQSITRLYRQNPEEEEIVDFANLSQIMSH